MLDLSENKYRHLQRFPEISYMKYSFHERNIEHSDANKKDTFRRSLIAFSELDIMKGTKMERGSIHTTNRVWDI